MIHRYILLVFICMLSDKQCLHIIRVMVTSILTLATSGITYLSLFN